MLTFLTATTGNIVQYDRKDCPDALVAVLRLALPTGILTTQQSLWRDWSVSIERSTADDAYFKVLLDGVPLTHCWLCRSEAMAEGIWEEVRGLRLPMLARRRPEATPWLAVAMTNESIKVVQLMPDRFPELPEIEIALAWAMLENMNEPG